MIIVADQIERVSCRSRLKDQKSEVVDQDQKSKVGSWMGQIEKGVKDGGGFDGGSNCKREREDNGDERGQRGERHLR